MSAYNAEYVAPEAPAGTYLLETFQGKLKDLGWISSDKDKYEGEFKISSGSKTFIPEDTGLFVPEKAMHYAISKPIEVKDTKTKDFVVQYQLRYDDYPTCGGAYLKLVSEDFKKPKEWDNTVAYSIMFGADKCGADAKVHFIMQQKNKKTGELVEHHLKNPPKPSADKDNHLYTLAVFTNQTFALLVDNEIERVGDLLTDFDPPVQPLKEIDDETDKKPDDWVDEEEIDDPESKKPDDWDEDAPQLIPDTKATKPEKWLDDAPLTIADPEATKPEDWDDEEDGEWEAPMIDNPKCEEAGCGEWKPPMINNPDYKGKWLPTRIPNPAFKGIWKPRKIANPDFYEVTSVHLLPMSAVGIEIWTMDKGYIFDNILVGDNLEAARQFAEATFGVAKKIEAEMKEKEIDEMAKKKDFGSEDDDLDAATGAEDEEALEIDDEEEEEKVDL